MTISQLKKEARVKWGIEVGPNSTQRGQEEVLMKIIDQVLDAVENHTMPEEALPSDWDDDDKPRLRASMYNRCREDVKEAFKTFRT